MIQVDIPGHFFNIKYNSSAYPGNACGFDEGANCQHFCYEILRINGFQIADLRSSNLWEDQDYSKIVESPKPFDLFLFNRDEKAWGAHVGMYLGEGKIIHLSYEIGIPVIWDESRFYDFPQYKFLIGIKRPIVHS